MTDHDSRAHSFSDGSSAAKRGIEVLAVVVLSSGQYGEVLSGDPARVRVPLLVFSADPSVVPSRSAAVLVKPSTSREILDTIGRLKTHEGRESPRYTVRFELIADDGTVRTPSRAINLSRGGVRFRSSAGATVGQSLALTLRIGGGSDVLVDGEVRNVQFEHSGWDIGARFTAVRANAPALDKLIREMEAGNPFGHA